MLWISTDNIRLMAQRPGILSSLGFKRSDVFARRESLADDPVEVTPHALGLNSRDVVVALSEMEDSGWALSVQPKSLERDLTLQCKDLSATESTTLCNAATEKTSFMALGRASCAFLMTWNLRQPQLLPCVSPPLSTRQPPSISFRQARVFSFTQLKVESANRLSLLLNR